jgi:hypothetical protein
VQDVFAVRAGVRSAMPRGATIDRTTDAATESHMYRIHSPTRAERDAMGANECLPTPDVNQI